METELSYGRFIERSMGGYIGSDGGVIERALGHYIGSDGGDDDSLYDCMFGICMQIWSEITSGGGGGAGRGLCCKTSCQASVAACQPYQWRVLFFQLCNPSISNLLLEHQAQLSLPD